MSKQTFQAVNPATGATLEPAFADATSSDVDTAVAGASEAFGQTQDLPPRWQADLLDRIAERIMDLGDALLERGEAETALPLPRLIGERARTTGQLKMFASIAREGSWIDAAIDMADPKRAPQPKPDLRRMLIARGPVAVFGASNLPFASAVVGGDTASALAAGCPVVPKGPPSHPGTSAMLADAVRRAIDDLVLRGIAFRQPLRVPVVPLHRAQRLLRVQNRIIDIEDDERPRRHAVQGRRHSRRIACRRRRGKRRYRQNQQHPGKSEFLFHMCPPQ
jgi:NADP-dependent aldehyde dehydrogenase